MQRLLRRIYNMRTLVLTALFILPASVFAAPGLPHQVYGSAADMSENTIIRAYISGVEIASTTVNGSERYGVSPNLLLLEDPEGTRVGSEVTFTADGTELAQVLTFENGGLTELNLTLPTSSTSGGGGGRSSSSPLDLNNDGEVNLLDFNILMANWGTDAADLNGDGKTDVADFNYLMINWS